MSASSSLKLFITPEFFNLPGGMVEAFNNHEQTFLFFLKQLAG